MILEFRYMMVVLGDIFGERGGDWGSIFLPNKWGIILSILFQIGLFMGVAFFVIFLYVVF